MARDKRSHPQAPLYYPGSAVVQDADQFTGALRLSFSQILGQISDDQVPESAVKQHEDALEVTIADPAQLSFWPADAAGALVNDGAGNLSWQPLGGGSPHALTDHTDVDAADKADGRILVWDETAGKHVYQDPPAGGGGSTPKATSAVSGTVKVNTDDPGGDPVVYRKDEVDTALAAKADTSALAAKQDDLTLTTVQVVTASLAAGASEEGNVPLGKLGMLFKVAASAPCWVRLYGNAAEAAEDSGRQITEDPDDGVAVLADLIFTSGHLTINLAPLLGYADRQAIPDGNVRYVIKNTGGSAAEITVDFSRITLES